MSNLVTVILFRYYWVATDRA